MAETTFFLLTVGQLGPVHLAIHAGLPGSSSVWFSIFIYQDHWSLSIDQIIVAVTRTIIPRRSVIDAQRLAGNVCSSSDVGEQCRARSR